MKYLLIVIGLIIFSSLFANEEFQFQTINDKVIINFENENPGINQQKIEIDKVIAVPSDNVEIVINNCEVSLYSKDGKFIKDEFVTGSNRVQLVKNFVMRELNAHQIKIKLLDEEFTPCNSKDFNITRGKKNISVLKNLDIEIIPKDAIKKPDSISQTFLPIYQSLVDNFDSSYLTNLEITPSKMLLICNPTIVDFLDNFIDWKKAKGISCTVATLDETGNTSSEIKNYIQNAYETWAPDYLLLIGDVNDWYAVPSFYFGSEYNVSDHPYTLLEGNDYFPEMIVGRISIDSIMELITIISKILAYEKNPYIAEPDWLTRALLVAGNYSSSPPIPSTPIKVSRWLREKMFDYGYTQVDTVFFPPTYPGTSEIINAINNGVGFVNYRGWGDANGWHYPEFHVSDMADISNGYYIPIMTSFVCNTGDFANAVDPCFGEAWLRLGTPSVPQGGAIFIGPSDLYTSTKYNNSIFSGFYCGVLDEGIFSFGSAVLRGKIELYNNFPLNQSPGDNVEFYFHVYNILGDPSLSMWTKVPEEIDCTLPDEISLGTNYLEINFLNLDKGIVTAIKDSEFYELELIEDGYSLLYLDPETEGEIEITVTAPNYIPYIDTINVISEAIDVGLYEYEIDGEINPGEIINVSIALKNYGSQTANSVSADLDTDNQFVNIISGTANYGDMNPGDIVTQNYQFEVLSNCPDNEVLEFSLSISDGHTAKFEVFVNALQFEILDIIVNDENGILEQGEEREITVSIENIGSVAAINLVGTLHALSDAVIVTDSTDNFGSILVNESGDANFVVHAQSDCYIGRNVPFNISLIDENGLVASVQFSLEIGLVDSTAPTGPDNFGYFAYDNNDTDYSECPTYNWYEIDPNEGGNGEVLLFGDDRSKTKELPFSFTYYNQIFDSLTICSNGWISLKTTWMTNFRNWNIPSALGPYAMIAPYWDDLIGERYTIGDTIHHKNMRICYYYNQSENIFIIEWNGCYNRYDDVSLEKFEIILYDPSIYVTDDGNGEIQFNYHTVNNPDANNNYATVGIEDLYQSDGLLYTYANIYPPSATPLQNNLAIKFTTDPPEVIYPFTANFSADTTSGYAPLTVNFSDRSNPGTGAIVSWSWDFGDNNTSEEQNPTHIYENPGNYTVSLTVIDENDSTNIETKIDYIIVYEAVIADFVGSPTVGISPLTVTFIDSSKGEIDNWLWNFGDDSTSTSQNPIHTYSNVGVYSVSLSVFGPMESSDTLICEDYIVVYPNTGLIWPGDTDYSGEVNEEDVDLIAVNWKKTGTPRSSISFEWIGNDYPGNWDEPLASLADCNGDGLVDITDVLAICLNWDRTHSVAFETPFIPTNLEQYRDNFVEIYNSLRYSEIEIRIRNHIAKELGLPIIEIIKENYLEQNFPNPFCKTTEIIFGLKEGITSGGIKIYNLKGQLVKKFRIRNAKYGLNKVVWGGKDENNRSVSNGIYLYKLEINGKTVKTKRMLLLK